MINFYPPLTAPLPPLPGEDREREGKNQTDARAHRLVVSIAASIRTAARSTAGDSDHAVSLEFSCSFGKGDPAESIDIGACPCVPTIPNEIVRAYVNLDNLNVINFPLFDLLRAELEPFIIGVGWIIADQSGQDLVICLARVTA